MDAHHPGPCPTKVVCGFSDFTALLEAFRGQPQVTALHGPSSLTFRDEVSKDDKDASWNHLIGVLGGEQLLIAGEALEHRFGSTDEVEGELIGGNLTIVCSLLGTPFEPDTAGKILFLEEVGESPYRIYRLLLQLQLAGKLDNLTGIVLGKFTGCTHQAGKGPSVDDVLTVLFDKSPIPVYRTEAFGHQGAISTLPVRKKARLSGAGLSLVEGL